MDSKNYGNRIIFGCLFIGILFASVSSHKSKSVSVNDFTCDPTLSGAFPHPVNCEQFYVCTLGVAALYDCATDLLYDISLGGCNYAEVVDCGNRTRPGTDPVIVCQPDSDYIPHPTDCTKFYQCSNGVPHLHQCPDDLHWDNSAKRCEWSGSVAC